MFPDVIREIILDYAATWELLDWIDPYYLSWQNLIHNTNAVDFMIKNPRETLWGRLSENRNWAAFYHIRANMPSLLDPNACAYSSCPDAVMYACEHIKEMIDFEQLSRNPLAIPWLRENPQWISWTVILANPSDGARDLLSEAGILTELPRGRDYSDFPSSSHARTCKYASLSTDMMYLCGNHSAWAMEIVSRNTQHISNISLLIGHPYAKNIIKQCRTKLKDKRSFEMAIENTNEIDWRKLSKDSAKLVLKNNNITFETFSRNHTIFELRQPVGVFELL